MLHSNQAIGIRYLQITFSLHAAFSHAYVPVIIACNDVLWLAAVVGPSSPDWSAEASPSVPVHNGEHGGRTYRGTCWDETQAWQHCHPARSVGRSDVSFGIYNTNYVAAKRHIFVCFMAKSAFLGGFFGPSSVTMGLTHIALGWNMSVTLRC